MVKAVINGTVYSVPRVEVFITGKNYGSVLTILMAITGPVPTMEVAATVIMFSSVRMVAVAITGNIFNSLFTVEVFITCFVIQ